jgi:hypothetical protein
MGCPCLAMAKKGSNKHGSVSPALTAAVRRILRPLVGFLLDHGLNYSWLVNELKGVFVDVAEREFTIPGKAQTDSRITLLTGVHRKDVRRLRSEASEEQVPPESVFFGAQVVALWISDRRFLDKTGRPKPLPRRSGTRRGASFEDLVAQVSTDIRPRSVLDEWLRLGAVNIDEQDRVCLKVEAFVPAKGFDEKAFYFGRNIHDHLAAARHNLGDNGPTYLERSVYYDDLSEQSLQTLAELSAEEVMKALKVVNRRARQLQAKDRKRSTAKFRMNFGAYFFQTPDPDNPEKET